MVWNILQAAVDEDDGTAAGVKIGGVTAEEIIAQLGLRPHPEGGHFVETFRAPGPGRSAGTAIYFLLKAGERSHWHRVDADETWHHYAGAPLELSMSDDGRSVRHLRLGSDFGIGEQPQATVPRHVWQAARSLGTWTLVGCTVAPAFEYSGFELAPPGWEPRS
jgi:predicted cupin superfamily sugar epimerase